MFSSVFYASAPFFRQKSCTWKNERSSIVMWGTVFCDVLRTSTMHSSKNLAVFVSGTGSAAQGTTPYS